MANRIERTWKNCIRMEETAKKAKLGAESLDDKLRMERLSRVFSQCAGEMRKAFFEYEDAEKLAENAEECDECGATHSK